MILTQEQVSEFEKASKPMMEFLGKNFHPHVTVIIDNGRAEILESKASFVSEDYTAG
jgi:ribosomal protein L30E